MQDSIRRVHKLQLTTQDENAVHGDISALQDAFRVASLPGIPPHGLMLIRKLDLGSFQTRSSPLALSQLIDSRLGALAPTAVCVDQGEHAEQPLVWFSDSLQAAICLIDLVVTKQAPRAWYWRVVFPSWRPGMSLQQTLAAVAEDRRGEPGAPAVLARVIETQLERGSIGRILDAFTPQLAQSLLREANAFSGPTDSSSEFDTSAIQSWHRELRPAWVAIIRQAVETWGSGDVRSLWLGYSAFTTQNPALVADSALLGRIKAAIETLAPPSSAAAARIMNAQRNRPATPAPEEDAGDAGERRVQTEPDRTRPRASTIDAEPATPLQPQSPVETGSPRSDSLFKTRSLPAAPDTATIGTGAKAKTGPTQNEIDFDTAETGASEFGEAGIEQEVTDRDPVPITFGGLTECKQSGLMFLVSLLELLSIRPLLENNPTLAFINLPARVFIDIAHRLRIPQDHPMLQALPQLQPVHAALEAFTSPDSWRSLIAPPATDSRRLHRFDTTPSGSHCYLTDRSRKLLLYVGPGDLPQWTNHYQITRHRGAFASPEPEDLSRTLQLLMCRYLRRYAGMSLRQVVNRAGHIASTRTHLDILFTTEQMDIRIRKSGLDIDPGWVAWLARVVQFHYDDGEAVDV
jgi:hypothetical protein